MFEFINQVLYNTAPETTEWTGLYPEEAKPQITMESYRERTSNLRMAVLVLITATAFLFTGLFGINDVSPQINSIFAGAVLLGVLIGVLMISMFYIRKMENLGVIVIMALQLSPIAVYFTPYMDLFIEYLAVGVFGVGIGTIVSAFVFEILDK